MGAHTATQAQPRMRLAARQRTRKPNANADDASPATHTKHANPRGTPTCRSTPLDCGVLTVLAPHESGSCPRVRRNRPHAR
eukprot:2222080-Prymnesium_polylepis.1